MPISLTMVAKSGIAACVFAWSGSGPKDLEVSSWRCRRESCDRVSTNVGSYVSETVRAGRTDLPECQTYCLKSIHPLLGDLCDAFGINLQLGNISRLQIRLGSKTETKSPEILVEDYRAAT